MIGVLFFTIKTGIFGQVDFATENRLDFFFGCLFVKLDSTIHIPMIGDGEMCLAKLFGFGNQFPYFGQAIQKREFGVNMKVSIFWHYFVLYLLIFGGIVKIFKWWYTFYMVIDYSIQILIAFRLIIAFGAGMLIGFDRERSGKAAGLRTQMLVCVGSALFAGLSIFLAESLGSFGQDPTRIIAQIVSGVGFLGAGVILKNGNRLSGVTTAATIWTTAAVGVAIGAGYYLPAGLTVLMILLLNPIAYLQFKFGSKGNTYVINFDKKHDLEIGEILNGLRIRSLQKSVQNTEINIHVLSNEQKNDKLIRELGAKEIKFSLEPTED